MSSIASRPSRSARSRSGHAAVTSAVVRRPRRSRTARLSRTSAIRVESHCGSRTTMSASSAMSAWWTILPRRCSERASPCCSAGSATPAAVMMCRMPDAVMYGGPPASHRSLVAATHVRGHSSPITFSPAAASVIAVRTTPMPVPDAQSTSKWPTMAGYWRCQELMSISAARSSAWVAAIRIGACGARAVMMRSQ